MTDFIASPLELFAEEDSVFQTAQDRPDGLNVIEKQNCDIFEHHAISQVPVNIAVSSKESIEATILEPSNGYVRIGIIDVENNYETLKKAFSQALANDIDILIMGVVSGTTENRDEVLKLARNAADTGHKVYFIHEPGHEFRLQ